MITINKLQKSFEKPNGYNDEEICLNYEVKIEVAPRFLGLYDLKLWEIELPSPEKALMDLYHQGSVRTRRVLIEGLTAEQILHVLQNLSEMSSEDISKTIHILDCRPFEHDTRWANYFKSGQNLLTTLKTLEERELKRSILRWSRH